MSKIKIEWITDWETIYSYTFQKQWLDWMENAENGHVFFHPSLCMAWLETYRPLRNFKPLFCIGRSEDNVFFLPLVLWKRNWKNAFQKLIIPIGYSDFDYHDPIQVGTSQEEREDFLRMILAELPAQISFDKLELNGLRSGSDELPLFPENDVAPFTELFHHNTLDNAKKVISTRLKGDIRRQMRRLKETGSLKFKMITDLNEALDLLPDFLNHHQKRWPNAYKAPNFHQNLLKFGLPAGITHFSVLKVDEHIVSYHLGFRTNERYYYYLPAYDINYERYSPGKVHLDLLFEYAYNEGCKIFDHLRGKENYKAGWTDQVQNLYCLNYTSSKSSSILKSRMLDIKKSFSR